MDHQKKKHQSPARSPSHASLTGERKRLLTNQEQPPQRCELTDTHISNIPPELSENSRWVLWGYRWQNNKWSKVPAHPNGKMASSTNPQSWSTFNTCLRAFRKSERFSGIGFVLGNDFVGIDVDNCRNPASGELSKHAVEILEMLPTYAEVSPTGTGIKLFSRGSLPKGRRTSRPDAPAEVEMYDGGRYFTVTGETLTDPMIGLANSPADLIAVYDKYVGTKDRKGKKTPRLKPTEPRGDAANQITYVNSMPVDPDRRHELDLAVLRDCLTYIGSEGCGKYDDWVRIGLALKSFCDSEAARELFVVFSREGDGYISDTDCRDKWDDLSPSGELTIKTIYHLAGENGWQWPLGYQSPIDRPDLKKLNRKEVSAPLKDCQEGGVQ